MEFKFTNPKKKRDFKPDYGKYYAPHYALYAFFKCGSKNDYVRIIPQESKCYIIPDSSLRENVLCAVEYNDEKMLPILTWWAMSDTGIDEEYKEEIKCNDQSVVITRI